MPCWQIAWGKTEDTGIQGGIIPFLLNCLDDRQIATGSRLVFDKHLRGIVSGPFDDHQKVLLVVALLGQSETFEAEVSAAEEDASLDPASEYNVAFCRELSEAFNLTGESIGNETRFNEILNIMMTDRIPKHMMPDILHAFSSPPEKAHKDFVASWILGHLKHLGNLQHRKSQAMDAKEATFAMKLCIIFKDVLDWENR